MGNVVIKSRQKIQKRTPKELSEPSGPNGTMEVEDVKSSGKGGSKSGGRKSKGSGMGTRRGNKGGY